MAEKSLDTKLDKDQEDEEDEGEDEDKGLDPNPLMAEEIMNLPDYEPGEDEETEGMITNEIIERANQRYDAIHGNSGSQEDGTYIVKGDIAMTKEEYEQYTVESR
jgi:hypothetical protein